MTYLYPVRFALMAVLLAACGQKAPPSPDQAESQQDRAGSGSIASTQAGAQGEQPVLTVYSGRHYVSDRELYQAFEAHSGARVAVRETGAGQLLETMKAEGENSPADIIILADAGSLWRFQDNGLTQTVENAVLNATIPAPYRQADGHWFGIARRLRGVVYDTRRWQASDVDNWDDLSKADKAGEICVRSSSNIYNLSLMSELIHRNGADAAKAWAGSVVANMARSPRGGDTDQIRAIAAGECSIAIVNHYYWLRQATGIVEGGPALVANMAFAIPQFADGRGAHVNITGMAMAVTADNPALAHMFMEFMLTPEAQKLLTAQTRELPIVLHLPGYERVPAFTPSQTPLDTFGENQAEAQRLFDLAGWD